MSRFWKISLLVVAVLVVVFVAMRMMGGGQQGKRPGAPDGNGTENSGPVPVTVVPAATQDVPVYATALGTVTALNTVTVNPQVSGQLMSLNFQEGQEVKKGALLAQIDPRTLQASYDQALAAKRQNQALLATARVNYQRQ